MKLRLLIFLISQLIYAVEVVNGPVTNFNFIAERYDITPGPVTITPGPVNNKNMSV